LPWWYGMEERRLYVEGGEHDAAGPSGIWLFLAALGIAAAYGLYEVIRAYGKELHVKKIFVSYDYDNDRDYRRLLSAWDANKNFSFAFEDHSTPLIHSLDAGRIKAAIAAKMRDAECLLVIVGRQTHRSNWVAWEIDKAKELGLKLIGVKLDRSYTTPSGLLSSGASWAMSFSDAGITTAVAAC